MFPDAGLLKSEKDGGTGLKTLVAAAGGAVAGSLPKDFDGILLGHEGSVATETKWFRDKLAKLAPLFGRTKLLTAIMQQEFDRGTGELAMVP